MGTPKCIITDGQTSISGALKTLKAQGYWDGQHLLDTFHELKTLRKKIKN